MHRSGTSAIAGVLDELKVYGGRDVLSPSFDNPQGFYENKAIVDFNDKLLARSNSSWSDVYTSILNWNSEDVNIAVKLIKEQFGDKDEIYIKDPRASLFIDLWIKSLESLKYNVVIIFALRLPSAIIKSLSKRNNFSSYKSIALIKKYWVSILGNLTNKEFVSVSYEELLSDCNKVFADISNTINWRNDSKFPLIKSIGSHTKVFNDTILENDNIAFNYLTTIYNAFSIVTESKNLSSHRIDELLDQAPKDPISSKLLGESIEPNFFKLFIDTGDGYSESTAIKHTHNGIDFSNDIIVNETVAKSIRLIPIHKKCKITIDHLHLSYKEKVVNYILKENSVKQEGRVYLFDSNWPTFTLDLKDFSTIDRIKIKFNFEDYKYSNETRHSNENIKSNISLFWHSIMLFITKPFSFVKHINYNNLRILRSALRRESPRTIYNNLNKLISNKNLQNKGFPIQQGNSYSSLHDTDLINTILYVTGELPAYDKSSGAKRAEKILSIIAKTSKVLILCNSITDQKYLDHYESLGIDMVTINVLRNDAEAHSYSLSAIIFNKYYTFFDFADINDLFPFAKIIIDAEDLAWKREERSIDYSSLSPKLIERNKWREIKAYQNADHLWCVTTNDRDDIIAQIGEKDISIVSNVHKMNDHSFISKDTKTILFFANYNHTPNVTALEILINNVLPLIVEKLPNVKLRIAGSSIDIVKDRIPVSPQIEVLGFIEENDVDELYKNSTVVIAPLLFGSGIKGKITEAIKNRVPVITNQIGNEGINLVNQESGFITEDFAKMADYAIGVFNNKFDVESITFKAFETLKDIVSVDSNTDSIISSIYPKVSICIVTHNGLGLMRSCIDSIYKNTTYPNFELLLYSNGCIDGTSEYIKELSKDKNNVKFILSDTNDVYVMPNNRLIELADANNVVLLNNDVTVTSGWLSHLVHAGRLLPKAGIVGAKVLFPDGRLQEFGNEIYNDGQGINIGKYENPNDNMYNTIKSVSYVSGCCMFIKRSTLDLIGSFDESFSPCYFEDSDLCYTAWEQGIITVVTHKSVVVHKEGATAGTDENVGFKKYQSINRKIFLSKHKDSIDYVNEKSRNYNVEI